MIRQQFTSDTLRPCWAAGFPHEGKVMSSTDSTASKVKDIAQAVSPKLVGT